MQTRVVALSMLLMVGTLSAAYGQWAGQRVEVDEPVDRDLYLAGRDVEVAAPVDADVVAAGETITIGAPVRQDLIALGETIRIAAAIGDDARLAGRQIDLSANVGDHLVAAGAEIHLASGYSVGGFAWLAGDQIRVAGSVGGELRIAAREVRITGAIGGNAEITAERIVLGPGARIAGDLLWRSENPPTIDPAAVIEGRTIAQPLPPSEPVGVAGAIFAAIAALTMVLVVGIAAYLLFPRFSEAVPRAIADKPLTSLGLGLAVFAATPVLVLVLLATGVGLLLGLMLAALYLMSLLLGWLAGAFCTGQWVLGLTGRAQAGRGLRIGAFVLAALVLALLQLIPLLGQLLAFAVLLFGLGGMVITAARRYRSPVPAP